MAKRKAHQAIQRLNQSPGQRAQLVRASSGYEGCGFDPRSGYIQEATTECIKKQNNRVMSLSLSLSSIVKNKGGVESLNQ